MEENLQIFGTRAIIEAIKADKPINKVYLQKGLKNPLSYQLEQLLKENKISVSYVPLEKLNKLSQKNHQGAIAHISPIAFQDFETIVDTILAAKENPLFLLLDQVSDVRNFGAIIRTAECAGVDAIILSKTGAAPINADTIKTSAGAAYTLPLCKVEHLKDALFYLSASNVQSVAATEKSDKNIYELDLKLPTALIMGSEGRGISKSILNMVNEKAKLPIMGKIESLNVSVACGAFLYEIVRQRL